jgi:hypothetical protein
MIPQHRQSQQTGLTTQQCRLDDLAAGECGRGRQWLRPCMLPLAVKWMVAIAILVAHAPEVSGRRARKWRRAVAASDDTNSALKFELKSSQAFAAVAEVTAH